MVGLDAVGGNLDLGLGVDALGRAGHVILADLWSMFGRGLNSEPKVSKRICHLKSYQLSPIAYELVMYGAIEQGTCGHSWAVKF